jgi:hypothetical protein
MLRSQPRRAHITGAILVALLVITIQAPQLYCRTHDDTPNVHNDYLAHIEVVQQMLESGRIQSPDFAYHLATVAVKALLPWIDLRNAALLAALAFQVSLGVVLYELISATLVGLPGSQPAALIALALMLVSPITLFTWGDHNLYLGYIGLNVYHNPTIIALRPLAILQFVYVNQAFSGTEASSHGATRRTHGGGRLMAAAITTILATAAKPSYAIALLPATVAMALYWLLKRRPVKWSLLFVGVALPSIATLLWQYSITYVAQPSRIVFEPLKVMRFYSPTWLLPKFFLSIAFPLTVYVVLFRAAFASFALNLGWMTFAVAALYTYFFAEAGPRLYHGNFGWSAQITLFILFLESTLLATRQAVVVAQSGASMRRFLPVMVCTFVFLLHLVSGLLWYYINWATPQRPWW